MKSLVDIAALVLNDLTPAIKGMVKKGKLSGQFAIVFCDQDGYKFLSTAKRRHWKFKYNTIAISKAQISCRTKRATKDVPPEERMTGDTKYSGSVWSNLGFAIGVSAHSEPFDHMVAQWIATGVEAYIELSKVQHFISKSELPVDV